MLDNVNKEKTEYFVVFGLQGSAQAAALKKLIAAQKGVIAATVNFAAERAIIRYDAEVTRCEMIIDAAERIGVSLEVENKTTQDSIKHRREAGFVTVKRELLFSAILAFPLLAFMLLRWFEIDLPFIRYLHNPTIQLFFAAPIMLWLGGKQVFAAMKSPVSFSTLVVLGSFGAFALSIYYGIYEKDTYRLYFDTAVLILIAAHLAKFFEMRAKLLISNEMNKIMQTTSKTATIIRDDDREELIDAENIFEEDILVIKGGERIAADGIIISGTSAVDESMLNGKSIPVDKFVGDKVYAGTINVTNRITISVSAVGDDTELAKIIRMVEDAQLAEVPARRRIEKVSRIFVMAILAGVLANVAISAISGGDILNIIVLSISILVIACPCALGLAASAATMAGTQSGIKCGVLFRVSEAFEVLKKIKILVLGKTETITSGDISVSELQPLNSFPQQDLRRILQALSGADTHPVAKAINEYCKEQSRGQGDTLLFCEGFEAATGGIKAVIDGSVCCVGNYEYIEESGYNVSALKPVCYRYESGGELPNIVVKDGEAIAIISLAETIRPTARQAVSELHERGIQVYMLTQDGKTPALRIAGAVGIPSEKVASELTPQDKADAVLSIKEHEKSLAMMGSGINDAVAMSHVPVAISLGATDFAADVSDIVINNSDLRSVCRAIEISRRTSQITSQNLLLACIFNMIGIPFALMGVLDPAIASLAMTMGAVCVTANSFRS